MLKQSDLHRKAQYMAAIEKAFSEAREEFPTLYAPHRAGDIIPVQGWSYKGKACMVEKIRLVYTVYSKTFSWRVSGKIVKADGTPGKNFVAF